MNIPMEVEIINLSDDESNHGDQAITSENTEELKESHIRKTADFRWFADYPWLRTESINGNTMLYCRICRECNGITTFARGTPLLRIDKIRDHMRTSEHKKSEELLKPNTARQLSAKKLEIISLMRIIYFCSKNNIPLNTYPGLSNLISLQIENNNELIISNDTTTLKPASLEKLSTSKSKYGSYNNCVSGFDFLHSIAHVIKRSLFEELNSSINWSIMIDETNSVDNDKYLAIVGKYIINNIPYMRYLGMVNLDSTDGESIFNQIKSFCTSKEIFYNNIIHFGSDGASNMIGMKLIKSLFNYAKIKNFFLTNSF
jgi:hypothetical protein